MSSTPPNVPRKENAWHLRKELSIGTIISLALLSLGSLGAYYSATAQIAENTKSVDQLSDVPARVVRIETQLETLKEQQEDLKEEISAAREETRAADVTTLTALSQIQVSIARLQQQLDDSE